MTEQIGARITRVRGQQSQAAFAKKLGVHKNTVGNYEREDRKPDADLLTALALIGVNIHWILTGEGNEWIRPEAGEQEIHPDDGRRFPSRLHTAMALSECSIRGLAKKVGPSEGTLRSYLRGDTYPDVPDLVDLAKALGCAVAWLATGESVRAPVPAEESITKEPKRSTLLAATPLTDREVLELDMRLAGLARFLGAPGDWGYGTKLGTFSLDVIRLLADLRSSEEAE